MEFGTVILESGKFGEEPSTPLDRCYFKIIMEGKIDEDCHEDPNMGGTGNTCWFVLKNVKRTVECKCEPMLCGDSPNPSLEEVSIHKGKPGGGFEFKWCKVYRTNQACPPVPYINWCSGKKTTGMPNFRTKSFGYGVGSCTTKDGRGGQPIVNLYTEKTGSCEKRLAAYLDQWSLAEATEHGIPAMCPGPAYN